MNRLTLLLLLGLSACKKGGRSLGEPGEPFGPLAKISFGMSDNEVVKKAPEFEFEDNVGRADVGDDEYSVKIGSVARAVYRMHVVL
jgi:hypothetical protein